MENRKVSALGAAVFRAANPRRQCALEGCDEIPEFGDFCCSPEHEDIIADRIAARQWALDSDRSDASNEEG